MTYWIALAPYCEPSTATNTLASGFFPALWPATIGRALRKSALRAPRSAANAKGPSTRPISSHGKGARPHLLAMYEEIAAQARLKASQPRPAMTNGNGYLSQSAGHKLAHGLLRRA